MKTLLALLAVAALLRWLRDRRTPEQRLASAIRDNDRDYLEEHLPRLTEEETKAVSDRVLSEVDEEARDGAGNGDWDQVRFARYLIETRRAKWERSRRG